MRQSFFTISSRQMFERETRREKIVETKLREIKLKTQMSDKPADAANAAAVQAQIAEAEARTTREMEKELIAFLETVVNYIIDIYRKIRSRTFDLLGRTFEKTLDIHIELTPLTHKTEIRSRTN